MGAVKFLCWLLLIFNLPGTWRDQYSMIFFFGILLILAVVYGFEKMTEVRGE